MPRDREPPSAFDLSVMALSPALIMGLVGSLGFFLLEVLTAGRYAGNLRWTLFFFVFGIVLVCRIALTMDKGRAGMYGLILSGLVVVAMGRFIDSPLGMIANVVVVGVVWWSANKLVWDCTHVDESQDDAGRGLMQEVREEVGGPAKSKAHPPGRWVVYFSLAALPLFGIGQSLIPASDGARRRYAFWLMTVYVGSGLGLLVTTSLLAMRRYLCQKRLQMPTPMTAQWLGLGAAMVAGFLLLGALLPRPHAEYPLIRFNPAGSSDRAASRFAQRGDDAGKGEGSAGAKGDDPAAKDGPGGKGQPGGKSAGKSGKADGGGDGRAKGKGGASDAKGGGSGKGQDGTNESNDGGSDRSSGADAPTPPSEFLSGVASVVKWIVIALLAIAVVLVFGWFLLKHLAQFSEWARRLLDALAALFGGRSPPDDEIIEDVEAVPVPRPFAEFRNPFADGSAAHQSPDALVRYSFAALEAWAAERSTPRRQDETPLEFAERLSNERPAFEDDARRFAQLYARLAYARRRLTDASKPQVERLWDALDRANDEAALGGASQMRR